MMPRTDICKIVFGGFILSSIFCVAAHQNCRGEQHTFPKRYTVRPDTQLVLKVPYSKVLYGEIPHIYVGIKNDSKAPLKLSSMFDCDTCNQLLFEARMELDGDNLTQPPFIPSWDKLAASTDFVELAQGESWLYETQKSQILYNYNILPDKTIEIRIALLTGPGEWVFSDWVHLQRLNNQPLDKADIVSTIDFSTIKDLPIRKATIEDQTYLFVARTRIARIPNGATPRFEWDKKKQLLTVHFEGVDVPPLVHFVRMIETRQWSPQTAPHMEELKSLKAMLSSKKTDKNTDEVKASPAK